MLQLFDADQTAGRDPDRVHVGFVSRLWVEGNHLRVDSVLRLVDPFRSKGEPRSTPTSGMCELAGGVQRPGEALPADVPIETLSLSMHRILCMRCGKLRWPKSPFMDGKHRFVHSFAFTVLDHLRFGTIRAVAEYLEVGWDLVKEIHCAMWNTLGWMSSSSRRTFST